MSELRLAGVATRDAANQFLATYFPRHNRRFAVPVTEAARAHRPLDPACRPETISCFKYRRTVAADNTVRFGERCLQLLPSAARTSWAKTQVDVHERLADSLAVYYARAGRRTSTTPAVRQASPRSSVSMPSVTPPAPRKLARNHPWRRQNLLPDQLTFSLNHNKEVDKVS